MSAWIATTVGQYADNRVAQLISPNNVDSVRMGIQSMLLQKDGVSSDLQNPATVTQLILNVLTDLQGNSSITVAQINKEAITRGYTVMISKYKLNQYYLDKIGYLPIPPPQPQNMSAYGLKPAREIYRGI
jgi:hypothetical protein